MNTVREKEAAVACTKELNYTITMVVVLVIVQEKEAAVACTKKLNCTITVVVVLVIITDKKINVQFAFSVSIR